MQSNLAGAETQPVRETAPDTLRREIRPALGSRLGTVIRVGIASASFGAAAIHAGVIEVHFREYRLFGLFFVVVAILQSWWGIMVLVRPTARLYEVGAVGMGLLVGVWAVSRSVGVPIGPEAGSPEAVGLLDVVATGFEVAIVAGLIILTRTRLGARPLERSRMLVWSGGVALAVAAATGGAFAAATFARRAGGQLTQVRRFLLPHFVHVAFSLAAIIVLAVYAFATRRRAHPPDTRD